VKITAKNCTDGRRIGTALLNLTVIRGSISQNNLQFGKFRNTKCTSCSVVTLCVASIKPVSMWTPSELDNIVFKGTEIHIRALEQFQNPPVFLSADEVILTIEYDAVTFQVSCILDPYQGNTVISFFNEVARFFEIYSYGVLTSNVISVAKIKKNETEFWVVDSHTRAETGNLVTDGVATAFKCANLENLITQLIYLTNIVHGSLFSLVPITVQVVSENQVNLLNSFFDENVSSSNNESLHKNPRMSLLKKNG